jgi:hypothetical protein
MVREGSEDRFLLWRVFHAFVGVEQLEWQSEEGVLATCRLCVVGELLADQIYD